ncbi:MAG: BatA domain-containing protein, partial [Planctomycetota bacterium]
MIFHNPAILAALPAVTVPVIIHIINRSRYRVVEWAAMEHLLAAKKKVRRRVLWENWLLLLVRTLIILALILALARPDFSDAGGGPGSGDRPVEWLVVLDDSTSMQHKPGQQTAMDRARQVLLERIEQLRQDRQQDRISIVLSSNPGEYLPDAYRIAPTAATIERLRESLALLRPSDRPTDWSVALDIAGSTLLPGLTAEGNPVAAIAVSDFRMPDWNDTQMGRVAEAAQRFAAFELLEAGFRESENLAVTALRCLDARPLAEVPARFELTVERSGPRMENVPLLLHLLVPESLAAEFQAARGEAGGGSDGSSGSGELPRIGSLIHYTVPVAPIPQVRADGSTAHIFAAAIPFAGATAIGVSVPADAYEADDLRWIALTVAPRLHVLLVDGKPGPRDFGGAADYLQLALAPDPSNPMGLDVTTVDHAALPHTAFSNFDVVLLANVDRLDGEPLDRLAAFARAGGGVGWFVGSESDPVGYSVIQAQAREIPRGELQPGQDEGRALFPAALMDLRRTDPQHPMHFRVDRPGHPLMEVFSGGAGLDLLMRTIRINRAWRVSADDPEGVISSVVNDDGDASPAVIETAFGAGHVVVVALGADKEWGNWPSTASFLIFVHTLINTLAPSDATQRTLAPGGTLQRRWELEKYGPTVTMTSPDG